MTGFEIVSVVFTGIAAVAAVTLFARLIISINTAREKVYNTWKDYAKKELENDRIEEIRKNTNNLENIPTLDELNKVSGVFWPLKILIFLPKEKWGSTFRLMGRDFARHFAAVYRIVIGPLLDGFLKIISSMGVASVNGVTTELKPYVGNATGFAGVLSKFDFFPSNAVEVKDGKGEDSSYKSSALASGYRAPAVFAKLSSSEVKDAIRGQEFLKLSKALSLLESKQDIDKVDLAKAVLGESLFDSIKQISSIRHHRSYVNSYLESGFNYNFKTFDSKNFLLVSEHDLIKIKSLLYLRVASVNDQSKILSKVADKFEIFNEIRSAFELFRGITVDSDKSKFADRFNSKVLSKKVSKEEKESYLKKLYYLLLGYGKQNILADIERAKGVNDEDIVCSSGSRPVKISDLTEVLENVSRKADGFLLSFEKDQERKRDEFASLAQALLEETKLEETKKCKSSSKMAVS